jgi:HK97 family phage major capsid protein
LAVLVKCSIELLQDAVNVADALEKSMIGALSVALDQAALFGDGSSNNPVGLFSTSGIGTVSMGTNGATASYDAFVDALYALESANAGPASAAIVHPRTLQTLRKLKDSQGRYLEPPVAVEDLPMLGTTSVPINQAVGTSSNCSTALVGDYSQAILGIRQELRVTPLNQAFMDHLQVGFVAHLRADVGFAHPESFVAITGIKP